MASNQPTLVVISEDPRTSHRANEAMRIALGHRGGRQRGPHRARPAPAVHLLDEDTDDLVDGDDIAKFRASLKKLGIPFHVEGALPTEPGWNADGHPVRTVSRDEIAALVPTATRFLVF